MMYFYQNFIAIVRQFGFSGLFVTFTINPKLKKIEKKLYPNQKAMDELD